MAITQVATAIGTHGATFSVASSGTQRALLVWLQVTPNVQSDSVSYAGAPLTRIGVQQRAEGRVELWAMTGQPQGVFDLVVQAAGASKFNAIAIAMNNVEPTFGAVYGQAGIGDPFSNVVSVTPIVATEDDFAVVGIFRFDFSTGSIASAAGQQRVWSMGQTNFDTVGDIKATGSGDFRWDLGVAGSTKYAALGISLRNAAIPVGGIHDIDMDFRAVMGIPGSPVLPGLTSWRLRYLPGQQVAANLQLSNHQPDAVDTGVITSNPWAKGFTSSVVGLAQPINGGATLQSPVTYDMPTVNGTSVSVFWKGMGFDPCAPGVPTGSCVPKFYEWITIELLADASATSPILEPIPPPGVEPPVDTWPPAGGGGNGGGSGSSTGLFVLAAAAAALLLLFASQGQNCDFECYKITDPILRAECETRQRKCLDDKARREQEERERRAGQR